MYFLAQIQAFRKVKFTHQRAQQKRCNKTSRCWLGKNSIGLTKNQVIIYHVNGFKTRRRFRAYEKPQGQGKKEILMREFRLTK